MLFGNQEQINFAILHKSDIISEITFDIMKKIRKAVFPVAGLGTRFLPATKVSPKEMLPVVDKPLVQYAVEDAVKAGLDTLIFITGKNKRAIEDHFNRTPELEKLLTLKGQHQLLEQISDILPSHVECIYMHQPEPKGLGDAVLCAQSAVGNDPFAVLLADDLIVNRDISSTEQLINCYSNYDSCLVMIEEVEHEKVCNYGVIEGVQVDNAVWEIKNFVEKPNPIDAPSHLVAVGRYLLTADIFSYLNQISPSVGGELQLTDAIALQVKDKPAYALLSQGRRYDCGSKLGYLQANIELALEHEQIKDALRDYLTKLTSN